MIIAITAHRPEKLGGFSDEAFSKLIGFYEQELKLLKPERLISGMAQGGDQASAIAAINLDIPVMAAIPFSGQEKIWPTESQDLYNKILENKLVESYIVCPGGFQKWKFQKRNEWMVQNCDTLLALYDGSKSGGTKNCIDYAKKINKEIINLWNKWEIYEEV